ncbi:MAG: ACP S-malonyltransferase [Planctomycetota bacterium]
MTAEAILFPGQGAQHPGMGKDWCDAYPAARRVFAAADEALGFPLSEACWSGGDAVHRTDIAQPGILTTSAAILAVLGERGLDPRRAPMTAGLSLGEYTALLCAGALELADAVRLVRLRGEAMQAASEATPSSMTSLMGADLATAEALAAVGRTRGICAIANLNGPGQVVLSGEIAALEAVEAAAKDHGIRRAVRLTVAGGFHSECMRPAAERLATALAEVTVRPPAVPVYSNVTGAPVRDPDEIRSLLARQVTSPVLWEKSMRAALAAGIVSFLEPGPGNVLSGLLRRIAKEAGVEVATRSAATPADLE